jgi:hypothetical protein
MNSYERKIPGYFEKDKETLFEENQHNKMKSNLIHDENNKLKVRVNILEGELMRKDKFIEEMVYANSP